MNNMKFRVESPDHSEQIQRELFRLGFDWKPRYSKKIVFKRKKYLFASSSTHQIFWDSDKETFNFASTYTETTLDELKQMK